MKPAVVLLMGVLAIATMGGVATAAGPDSPPSWTDDGPSPWQDETTTENNSSVAPGQQLAGAVGAQGASVESELWDRSLSERLDDATSDAERAAVLAEEIETIETYVEALEGVRANLTAAWERDEISEGEYRSSLSGFVVRARSVELRANRTVNASEELSPAMRDAHDVNATHARNLSDRAADLYQFEDEIGEEVANETLENESADSEIPLAGEQGDE